MGRPPRITREQILESARVAFTARGFHATTLADVAAELGVTAAAILRYFPSKQELFMAAMSTRDIAVPPSIEELARTDAVQDPRVVLRRFAGQFIPFVSAVIRPSIAVQMHRASRHTTALVVPFDTQNEENPSRRGLRIVSDYFRRAMEAGVIRPANPRAMALLFVAQLHSYVFIHDVLEVRPVHPLDDYLDALIDLWVEGAIRTPEAGGPRARNQSNSQTRPAAARAGGRGGGGSVLRPEAERAATARPRRSAGSKDGGGGVAGGRARSPRSRR